MLDGSGTRTTTRHVEFSEHFTTTPTVTASLGSLDVSNGHDLRVTVTATEISEHGFNLNFMTWADSQIYKITACWTAMGS
ncbi:H-type lectin domain-containing protein [Micromonospora sp. WMMD723]|uniref:H-type lectin domain-containing protein n=1 Tax=Micromonospora sp. WMMD723 TaxID=3403465 RepID=UPI003CEBA22D